MQKENQAYADALEAHLFVLEAELEVRSQYTLNREFNLQCAVLRQQIELIRQELEAVTR